MQQLHIVIVLVGIAVVTACAARQPPLKTISAKPFSFEAPADLQPVVVRGIDSNVGRYTNATTEVSTDYGWYSDPLTTYNKDKAGYQEERVEVDGKPAVIVSFSNPGSVRLAHCAGIHFPKLGDGRIKLTVFASCANTNQFPALKALFKSIRFEKSTQPAPAGT